MNYKVIDRETYYLIFLRFSQYRIAGRSHVFRSDY